MDLEANSSDRIAALIRGVAGLVPGFGNMISEVLTALIPEQRIDRLSDYIRALNEKIKMLDADLSVIRGRLSESDRLGIFEDGLIQAARSATSERRERIASVIAYGLSEADFNYERIKKVLNILDDLTDAEIIVLKSFDLRGEEYREFSRAHSWVLRPASREVGSSRSAEEGERAALQDAWRLALERLGLIATAPRGNQFQLTALGRLVLRHLFVRDEDSYE
jgi:hypothetical protein